MGFFTYIDTPEGGTFASHLVNKNKNIYSVKIRCYTLVTESTMCIY